MMNQLLLNIVYVYNIFIIVFFFILNGTYILLNLTAFFSLRTYVQEVKAIDLGRIFRSTFYLPVSVIVPAYNEAITIVDSTKSLLQLKYPEFEIVIVNDGSSDKTLDVLVEAFNLRVAPRTYPKRLASEPIKAVYTSADYPELVVIDKENGGKADSLNAATNVSRFPVFCTLDADSTLERDCLLKVMRPFIEDPRVIAVGGIVRVVNNCVVKEGDVLKVRLPRSNLARFQVIEYLRAFLFGRVGWSTFNSLLVISGAFGAFKKEAVIGVGGYRTDTIGEDMELVVRLHHFMRERKKPYRITFVSDPVCWTEAPEDIKTLARQRSRWQTGLTQSLLLHIKMLFNPSYGLVGMAAMPFFFFMEMLGPIVEFTGFIIFGFSLFFGLIDYMFAFYFFLVAFTLGVVLSTGSLVLEELSFRRYPRIRDIMILFIYAFIENFGYRQLHAWWRLVGLKNAFFGGGKAWGEMKRLGR